MKTTTNRTVLLGVAVCLLFATAGKPWVNKAARERRGGYRAHLIRPTDRAKGFGVVTFYALGDWGEATKQRERVAALLRADVARIEPREVRPFVLGTGDNLYPNGLPKGWPTDHIPGLIVDRAFSEPFGRVEYQNEGLTWHVVHGNHDYRGDIFLWETFVEGRYEGTYGGQRFVSYTLHDKNVVDTNSLSEYEGLMEAQKEGRSIDLPEIVPLPTASVTVIAIDTEAMLRLTDEYRHHKDDDPPHESATILGRHYAELSRLLRANADSPWVVVVGHHPVASHGPHGGYQPRPLGLHLEKLFEGTKSLVGAGDLQDLGHSAYKMFADRLYRTLAAHGRNVVYVSGHEHSLQFLNVRGNLLQVISGAGSKLTPVSKGKDTIYKEKEAGFVRFDVSGDQMWIEFVDSHSVDRQHTYIFQINR